jgi:hypothetical protein
MITKTFSLFLFFFLRLGAFWTPMDVDGDPIDGDDYDGIPLDAGERGAQMEQTASNAVQAQAVKLID